MTTCDGHHMQPCCQDASTFLWYLLNASMQLMPVFVSLLQFKPWATLIWLWFQAAVLSYKTNATTVTVIHTHSINSKLYTGSMVKYNPTVLYVLWVNTWQRLQITSSPNDLSQPPLFCISKHFWQHAVWNNDSVLSKCSPLTHPSVLSYWEDNTALARQMLTRSYSQK